MREPARLFRICNLFPGLSQCVSDVGCARVTRHGRVSLILTRGMRLPDTIRYTSTDNRYNLMKIIVIYKVLRINSRIPLKSVVTQS